MARLMMIITLTMLLLVTSSQYESQISIENYHSFSHKIDQNTLIDSEYHDFWNTNMADIIETDSYLYCKYIFNCISNHPRTSNTKWLILFINKDSLKAINLGE